MITSPRSPRSVRSPAGGAARSRRRWTVTGLLLSIALIVAGCRSGAASGPTPATFTGVAASLRAHQIEIARVVSGEAGCDEKSLISAAIAFDASGLDQTTPVRVHLYTFGDGAAYGRLAPLVNACAGSYPGSGPYTRVDQSPYVAAGRGQWGPQFQQAIRSALADAQPLGQ